MFIVYVYCLLFIHVLICIMHSAFNLLVFPNSMFTPLVLFLFFFIARAMCSPETYHLKITIIIIIIIFQQ